MKRSLYSAVAVLAAAAAMGCSSSDVVTDPPAPPPPPPPPSIQYQAADVAPNAEHAQPASVDAAGRAWFAVDQADGRHVMRWDAGQTTDIGTLPGPAQLSFGAGAFAGTLRAAACVDPCDRNRALYVWNDGALTEIALTGEASDIRIRGANAAGSVLADIQGRVVLASAGSLTDIGPGTGVALNAQGQVAGTITNGTSRAFLWQNGALRELDLLPGGQGSEARAMNANGDVVGWASDGSGRPRAVLWRAGGVPVELAVGADDSTWAVRINDAGQVLVASTAGRRWLWDNGTARAIGVLGQRVTVAGLNELGEVYGSFYPDGASEPSAFVWRDGRMHNLGVAGHASASVTSSNARGDLAGYYLTASGGLRPVMWKRLN